MAENRRSTLALVAERAGVSIASVSRVLNGLPASNALGERVRTAARELGYVPDAAARSLKVGRTEQIALAVADVGNPVYVTMMHEVARRVSRQGFRVVITSTGPEAADSVDLLSSLAGYADGAILSPLRITEELLGALRETRLPVVIIGSVPDDVPVDVVRADSATGAARAFEHLRERGRRRIAFVNGPVDTVPGAARLRGYLAAREESGLPENEESIVEAEDFTYRAGRSAVRRLLAQSSPDAILAANDLLAVAALKELTKAGRRVPEDVAIVGMDDTDAARLAIPSLTSVDLGSRRRAKTAAKLLLARIADPSAPYRRVTVEPSLSIRESS